MTTGSLLHIKYYSGGFDSFQFTREQYFAPCGKNETFIEALLRYGQLYQQSKTQMQNSLFGFDDAVDIVRPQPLVVEKWPAIEKLNRERELVGIYLSAHPLDEYDVVLHHLCNTKCGELGRDANVQKLVERNEMTFGGIITKVEERTSSRTGKPFGIVTIEDFETSGEIAMYDEDWSRWKPLMSQNYTIFVVAQYVERWAGSGKYQFKVQSVEQMYDVKRKRIEKITITLNEDELEETDASELSATIHDHPGDTPLYVQVNDMETQTSLLLKSHIKGVDVDRKFLMKLENMNHLEYRIN